MTLTYEELEAENARLRVDLDAMMRLNFKHQALQERERADDAVAAHVEEQRQVQEDVRDLLEALDMFSGARPQTPHDVMRECIERVRVLNGKPCLHSCTVQWNREQSAAKCRACGDIRVGVA